LDIGVPLPRLQQPAGLNRLSSKDAHRRGDNRDL
jgi:hypothetical protein